MKAFWDGPFRLVEHDPETGRLIWMRILENGFPEFRIDYPVGQLLQENAVARSESDGRRWGEWARVARIPLNLYYASGYAEAVRQSDRKWIARWLNDGSNRAWRTKEGKV